MARFNAGNVVLFYPPYRIDLSLNFFLLLLLLLFLSIMSSEHDPQRPEHAAPRGRVSPEPGANVKAIAHCGMR